MLEPGHDSSTPRAAWKRRTQSGRGTCVPRPVASIRRSGVRVVLRAGYHRGAGGGVGRCENRSGGRGRGDDSGLLRRGGRMDIDATGQAERYDRENQKQGSAHGWCSSCGFWRHRSRRRRGEFSAGSWHRPVRFVAGSGRAITSRCAMVSEWSKTMEHWKNAGFVGGLRALGTARVAARLQAVNVAAAQHPPDMW